MNYKNILLHLTTLCLSILLLSCTDNTSTLPPIEEGSARYQLTFRSTWTATTHPDNFPASPHFSGLIGGVHNINVNLWQAGNLASAGMESMAETGSKTALVQEIQNQIVIGDANTIISEGGLPTSPNEISIIFDVSPNYSFLSIVSMLAPSPDWFVGVSALNLLENGVWLEKLSIDLEVYDAGTDDGPLYTSANQDTSPKQLITKITYSPFLVDNNVKPIGQFIITRLSPESM